MCCWTHNLYEISNTLYVSSIAHSVAYTLYMLYENGIIYVTSTLFSFSNLIISTILLGDVYILKFRVYTLTTKDYVEECKMCEPKEDEMEMSNLVHFPANPINKKIKSKNLDIFSDLSDILGIDMKKVMVDKDTSEIKSMQKKLQKETLRIRSEFDK